MAMSKFRNKRTDAEKRNDRKLARSLKSEGFSERMIAALVNERRRYSLSRSQVRLDLNHAACD